MRISQTVLATCGIALSAISLQAQEVVLHSSVIASGGVSHARETATNHQLSSTIGQTVISNRVSREGVYRHEGFWVPWPAAVVSVQDDATQASMQAFPNPFAEQTRIVIGDEFAENVEISLHTLTGIRVRTLTADVAAEAQRSVDLTSTDDSNQPLASGQYICSVSGNSLSGARIRAHMTITILK